MFNVLPNIFKKEIRSEYYLRRLIVILIFVIFTQITFLVFIFPSWLSSFYQHEEVSMQMESQKSTVVSQNTNNILQTIKTTNQNLGIIDSAFNYSKVLSLIQDIISVKTSAVSLSEFTYSNSAIGQGDGGTGSQTTAGQTLATSAAGRSMSVSGVAQTREDLVGFVKKLQDSGFFSDVVSPISDLAKDKDISFSINLNVK